MLILRQKSFKFCTPCLKTQQFILPYPKVKYCDDFTKGDFSQSSFKEVITLFEPVAQLRSIAHLRNITINFDNAFDEFLDQKLMIFPGAKKFGQSKLLPIILEQIGSTTEP